MQRAGYINCLSSLPRLVCPPFLLLTAASLFQDAGSQRGRGTQQRGRVALLVCPACSSEAAGPAVVGCCWAVSALGGGALWTDCRDGAVGVKQHV